MTDRPHEDEPIAESILQPEPFPRAAELLLADHIVRLIVKEAADVRASS